MSSWFDDADMWPETPVDADTSKDDMNEVLEQVRAAYDPHTHAYLHAFHHAHIGALAALDEARTPTALNRAASKLRRWQEYGAWLAAASEIATRHEIHDAPGHRALAEKLAQIRDRFESAIAMRPEGSSWSVPHGIKAPWKTSQRRLAAILNKLESVEQSMGEVVDDPAATGAIKYVDTRRQLERVLPSLHALKLIIQAASRLEPEVGNRRLPNWTIEAADACRTYWRTLERREPRPWFVREEAPAAPANPFSRWFCDLMSALALLQPFQCETILRKKLATSRSEPSSD